MGFSPILLMPLFRDDSCGWHLPLYYHLQNLGFAPIPAASQEELLELAAEHPVEVIILDHKQEEAARRLKEQARPEPVFLIGVCETSRPLGWPWDAVLQTPIAAQQVKDLLHPALIC